MEVVASLQVGAALVINSGFAWMAGVLTARRWLRSFHPVLFDATDPLLRRSAVLAAVAALCGIGASLWAATAIMGDMSLREAWLLVLDVAIGTAYGKAGLVCMAATAMLAAANALRWHWLAGAAMLVVFALARAAVSHAGEEGVLSVAYGLDVIHLLLIGIWLGGVAVAGWLVLPAALGAGVAVSAYLQALSAAATVALGGIVATGVFSAWQRLESVSGLIQSAWGVSLGVKLILVALAVSLGAYSRWWGFPSARLDGGNRAMRVLRLESLVLAGALAAASYLTVQVPPG